MNDPRTGVLRPVILAAGIALAGGLIGAPGRRPA